MEKKEREEERRKKGKGEKGWGRCYPILENLASPPGIIWGLSMN